MVPYLQFMTVTLGTASGDIQARSKGEGSWGSEDP